jgi:predicted ester cyclase
MATQLTPDEMKALVRQHFDDFVNNHMAEVIRHNMSPDFRDHDGPGGRIVGIAEDEQMMRQMYTLMPDIRITIEDMVAEGDRVVCRNIWRWTDATSGAPMEFHGFVEWRFEGNLIAERWATVTAPHQVAVDRAPSQA